MEVVLIRVYFKLQDNIVVQWFMDRKMLAGEVKFHIFPHSELHFMNFTTFKFKDYNEKKDFAVYEQVENKKLPVF